VSLVVFRQDRWCKNGRQQEGCYEREARAMTSVFVRRSPGRLDDGEILEADLELNAVDYRLTAGDGAGARDLRVTLVHELGHVLGFEHPCSEVVAATPQASALPPCEAAPPEVRAATMFPAEAGGLRDYRLALSLDERRGLCDVYPRRPAPACGGVLHERPRRAPRPATKVWDPDSPVPP
jgi:hypothetical protein